MGNGKGNPEFWVAEIQPGKVLYEMEGVSEELAREAFRMDAAKLPIYTTFVSRHIGAYGDVMKASEHRYKGATELSKQRDSLLQAQYTRKRERNGKREEER